MLENEDMRIEELDVGGLSPGKHRRRLGVLLQRDGSLLSVPVGLIGGAQPGPTVCLVAGQHGDEWNGPCIIHEVFKRIDPKQVAGNLVLIPVANPQAFVEKNRTSRVDGVDMNRVYQFLKGHRPTEQLAKALFDNVFSRCQHLFDLHSGGPGEYLPHIAALEDDIELARAVGLGRILLTRPHRAEFERFNGSLVPACLREGITAILAEIGQGRSIQRQWTTPAIAGVLRYLVQVGSLSPASAPYTGGPEALDAERPADELFREKWAIKSPVPGVFEPTVELGDRVEKGDELGRVFPLLHSEPHIAHADGPGTVFYVRREQMMAEGESLYHLASDDLGGST